MSALIKKIITLPLISIFALTACGGSGSDEASVETKANLIQLDDDNKINQGVDLVLLNPDSDMSDIQWQQTSGSAITMLASTSKVISFTPTEAGIYEFSVSYKLSSGSVETKTHSVEVLNNVNKVTARLSHEARAGNKVSFRAQFDESIDLGTIRWTKTQGPDVTLSQDSSNGEKAIYFDAPSVDKDTLVTFEVSAISNGTTYKDNVTVLVEPAKTIDTENVYFEDRLAKVFAYNSASPYADKLVDCVYSNELSNSCTFNTLPLIAQEDSVKNTITPSVNDIMDRVVVSHKWMGDRFKAFLENQDSDNDFKNLLRATTAVVISYDVRPSFYWAVTGAIYLDASNFWLTPQERDTINQAPDYRADFGNDLNFVMPWRYVKNNAYASDYFSIDNRIDRTAEDGLYRLASLMYHELAHANDFLPSTQWLIHNDNSTVLEAACSWDGSNCTNTMSLLLSQSEPLSSTEMYALAEVSFKGETANTTQKAYLPSDIARFFSPDKANDFYGYSSIREDYAMLFEELMMKSRYGIDRDVAITNQPTGDVIYANDYIVEWGQRGRIGETDIKPRVLFSASNVLPEFDSISAVANLAAPIPMVMGKDWYESLTISPSKNNISSRSISLFSGEATRTVNRPVNTYRHAKRSLPITKRSND